MGIVNREGALYMATGIDNTGLYSGRREAMGIIKAMASQITSFDVFSGIGLSAATAFASAAKDAYNFEKEFRKNMLEVATISAQIGGSMTENMNKVMAITQQIPISAPEAAKALYQIVSAGHDGADGMHILEVAAKSAVGGLTDTATAADAITTILNAYKLSADHAANISDQLFTTVRLGKTDFGQLGTSIAQVAPIAAAYGIGIDEVLGAVASLTKQGVPTSQAMTQIRAAVQGASKELGDAAFQGRTFQEALQLISEKAGGSASTMKEKLGTDEGLAAALALTGKNAQSAAADLGELQNSAGATEAAFQKMQEDVDNQMKLLSNNIHAALRPMGEAILKEVSDVAKSVNEAFADGRAEAALKNLGDLIIIVGGAFIGYKGSVMAATMAQRLNVAVLRQAVLERQMEKVALLNGAAGYQALTAAQLKQVAARKLLTSAIKAQTAAFLKNTAALLSSPYVLAAAAVSVLGYGLYELCTYQTESEKAQKKLNETIGEFNKQVASEQAEIDRLFDKLKNTKKETSSYQKVKDEIIGKYGNYLKGLNSEIEKLNDVEGAYRAISAAAKQAAADRAAFKATQDAQSGWAETVQDANEQLEKALIRHGMSKGAASAFIEIINDELREIGKLTDETQAKINRYTQHLSNPYGKNYNFNNVQSEVNRIIDANKLLQDTYKQINSVFSVNSNEYDNLTREQVSAYLSSFEKAISHFKKTGEKQTVQLGKNLFTFDSEEELMLQLRKLQKVQKAFENGNEGSSNKLETILQRKITLTKELSEAEANLKKLRSPESTASQAEIDEAQKKVDETKAKLKALTGLIEKESDTRQQTEKKIHDDLLSLRRQNQQAEIDLMTEGAEKRLAQIELNYDNEIAAILAKEKEWKAAQAGKLTSEQTVEIHLGLTNAWMKKEKLTSGVNKEQIEAERQAMNEYLKEYGSYLEKRQAITDLYNDKIAKALTRGEKLRLAEEMKKELAAVDDEASKMTSIIAKLFSDMSKQTVSDIRAIADEAQKMLDYVSAGEFKTDEIGKGLFGLTKEQFDVLRQSPEKLQAIKDEIAHVRAEADLAETSFNKVAGGLKKVFAAGNDAKKLKEGLVEIEEGMSDVIQAGQFLSDTLSGLGDAFGSDTFNGIAEGVNVAMGTINSAMQGAKAGSVFGPIGTGAGAALGAVTSLASAIAKIHDKKNEKRIQRLQDQVDILERSYDKLSKSIEKAYSQDASKLIGQQNEMLEQQKALIKNQIREEKDKKKTDWDRIKEWEKQIEDINNAIADNKEKAKDAIFGADVKSAIDDFAQAYVDAWAAGEDRAKNMKDVAKNMIKGVIVEMLKSSGGLGDAVAKVREMILGYLSDGIVDEWEQGQLDEYIERTVGQLDKKYSWADRYLKGEETETNPRQSSAKSIAASITQESADALNGNFNAQLIYSNKTAEGVASLREQLGYIYQLQLHGWQDVRAIRDLTDKVNRNTQQISEVAEQLVEISESIKTNTKNTADGVQRMNDKGLYIKR